MCKKIVQISNKNSSNEPKIVPMSQISQMSSKHSSNEPINS